MVYMPIDGKPDRVHIGARKLDLDTWIEISSQYDTEIALKHQLFATKQDEVFLHMPMGDAGSREVLDMLIEHLVRIFPDKWPNGLTVDPSMHPLLAASMLVQEDLCLMTQVGQDWVLSAASVCFPSRWDVRDKIGKNLLGIHGPVPHYEEAIGVATQNIFDKLTVERPIFRVNWTVMDSHDLHQPVAVRDPDAIAVSPDNISDTLFFRRERQTLRKLPHTGDILFTIRTYTDTFGDVERMFPEFRKNIGTTIVGASPQTVDYKGWVNILNDIQAWSASEV
ncbi:MAG: DUF3445 domain-containing protein [Actinomycetes bacterium]